LLAKPIHTVIKSLRIPQGAHVLEVGIGTGLSIAAYPSHCQMVGVDVAAAMLAKAREKADKHG
jgi:phosphatidylethanolamine/phosphatidyl-N-methylethanolamine N-methyltransferase